MSAWCFVSTRVKTPSSTLAADVNDDEAMALRTGVGYKCIRWPSRRRANVEYRSTGEIDILAIKSREETNET